MRPWMARRLTYANVTATIALFVALGGTALASFVVSSNSQVGPGTIAGARAPSGDNKNIIAGSIGTNDLANQAVSGSKLGASSVTSPKIADGTITGADFGNDALTGTQIDESTLGTVPSAANASNAGEAANASSLGDLEASDWQQALSGKCSTGSAIGVILQNGSVTCRNEFVRPPVTNGSVTFSVAANTCGIAQIAVSGAAVGDTAIFAPDGANWASGLVFSALRSTQAGHVPMDLCNPTTSTATVSSVGISYWLVKATP